MVKIHLFYNQCFAVLDSLMVKKSENQACKSFLFSAIDSMLLKRFMCSYVLNEPRCKKKTNSLQGFRPGLTQTGLYSNKTMLDEPPHGKTNNLHR